MPLASPLTDQLQGWGTAVAALVAIAALVAAVRAYQLQQRQINDQAKTNTKQLEVLELQAKNLEAALADRERDARERRRHQAEQVNACLKVEGRERGPFTGDITVVNRSQQPVYNLCTHWLNAGSEMRFDTALSPDNPQGRLDPGVETFFSIDVLANAGVGMANLRVWVEFIDAKHVRWRTYPDGWLEELPPLG